MLVLIQLSRHHFTGVLQEFYFRISFSVRLGFYLNQFFLTYPIFNVWNDFPNHTCNIHCYDSDSVKAEDILHLLYSVY